MVPESINNTVICVLGLGYVGLPLAEAFSHHVQTIGYDIDKKKVNQIIASGSKVKATCDPQIIRNADVIMICVPTPVTKAKDPDLGPVKSASTIIGQNIKKGVIVVLESTVFPGATEEILVPILEAESGMKCGVDFFIGYSPERINPNDDKHTIKKITKIVAGMDDQTTKILTSLYSLITNVYEAPNIRTAEAAKVIENIQRDLNIALINELALIFDRMKLDTQAVLDAAGTKWNFHHYTPGLVGGHCIPVDPYYLVMKAEEFGYHPQIILAGRAINDSMPHHIANLTIKGLNEAGKVLKDSRVLIMGVTYKEDVPDIRESPVTDIIRELKEYHIKVYGYDPLISSEMIERFGITALSKLGEKMDAIIIAAPHTLFRKMQIHEFCSLMRGYPVLVDVKGILGLDVGASIEIYYKKL